jgi:hypothetical protein
LGQDHHAYRSQEGGKVHQMSKTWTVILDGNLTIKNRGDTSNLLLVHFPLFLARPPVVERGIGSGCTYSLISYMHQPHQIKMVIKVHLTWLPSVISLSMHYCIEIFTFLPYRILP